ncbi:hypothetical protein [Rhizobium sp. RU36D]|uniref:hypothetical protein n=1 Tax=Rhizobium sp. RU36D TaxID=1907415 RepID=UPI0009D8953A|nr:hypothetical protein [Rhizobium sp. RU36D]SMD07639.1 hypothetical protein SAMN05880593_119100 [Rhizobium sp. RU36D]
MEQLPEPTRSARNVVTLTGAVCSELLPGFSVLKELYGIYLDRKIEHHREELVKAIEAKGISALSELSDEQAEFLLPAAYRFFEQVRLGEFSHNLKILAAFIAGCVVQRSCPAEAGEVGRFARQLEYLDIQTLNVLSASLKLRTKIPLEVNPNEPFVSGGGILYHFPEFFSEADGPKIRSSLAILSSRGFLYPDGGSETGKTEESYYLTQDAWLLHDYLQQ